MFRLGGISNIREMWFAQKMNGKKKKTKILFFAGTKLWRKTLGFLKSSVFDYELFSKQVFD